jgi:hypothetical protein
MERGGTPIYADVKQGSYIAELFFLVLKLFQSIPTDPVNGFPFSLKISSRNSGLILVISFLSVSLSTLLSLGYQLLHLFVMNYR